MGLIQDFFRSPRERANQGLYDQNMSDWESMMNEISGLTNSFNDQMEVDNANKTVQRMLAPSRSALSTRLARSRSAAADRLGGRDAMPEMTFGQIESAFAPAFADLEAGGMGQVSNILSQGNQFKLGKTGMRMGGIQGKVNSRNNYLMGLSDDSTFDDLLATGELAAKMYGAGVFGSKSK